MANTRAQVSAPILDATSCGNCPPVASRMDNHPDLCLRALTMRMDGISKAVQTIYLLPRATKFHHDLKITKVPKFGRIARRGKILTGQNPYQLRNYLNEKRMMAPPQMEEKFEKIWQHVFGGDTGGGTVDLRRSPFTMENRTRPLPHKFKMPNLDVYDGSTNPMDHLDHFRTHLSLQGLDEMTIYQCFSLTLKSDISKLTNGVKLIVFLSALDGGNFFRHLVHKKPQTFNDAKVITRAYIVADEANEAKKPRREEIIHPRMVEGKRKDGNRQETKWPDGHAICLKSLRRLSANPVEDLNFRDETMLQQAQSGELTDRISLDLNDPERYVEIGSSLPKTF
ncbi:hypothetical protein Nepgr_029544 [Nepenthes gracilis]|uniref:Uncharacterized protein n=1 Tax=Nepenthes gracilis TaxID=150966 RepID=A0AAD3TEC3_NEPGR|nr:hypothetical protein Nepgr_029544 [Nepenthes gracilis]